MIANIRPPNRERPPSPLARARQMVAETLLPDRIPPRPLWQRWRKQLVAGAAALLALAGVVIYFWFR
jgi:hypothetical protein